MVLAPMLLIALVVGQPEHADAKTWYVTSDGTGDAPTIQAGIDAASPGDEVVVAAGTYTWSTQGGDSTALNGPTMVTMRSGVVLRSESGSEVTILDAEMKGRAVRLNSISNARLEGFTISRGNAPYAAPSPFANTSGGGILCRFSFGIQIRGNVLRDNASWAGGGGVSILDSDVVLANNIVSQNASELGPGGVLVGGGGTNAQITGNTFAENIAGGVLCNGTTATISGNLILDNHRNSRGLNGIGVECFNSNVTLSCNNAWGNMDGDYLCALGPENISDDPLLCVNNGSYRLLANSPCLPDNNACGILIGAGSACTTSDAFEPIRRARLLISATPNPFNPVTRIHYQLPPLIDQVHLRIYDLRGRLVATLATGPVTEPIGFLLWDGTDTSGAAVAAGVYIVRADTGQERCATKLVLAN